MNQSAKQILIVENSRTARASLESKLSSIGYQTLSVGSGKEAFELLQKQPFDLIVMDVFLPELNGYEAAQKIRALTVDWANLPIVAYSSSQTPFDKQKCLSAGINEYLIKSDDHKALINWIQNH